jgi:hypothetical protein
MLWEVGYANKEEVLQNHCLVDGKECYEAKTVPVIFGISRNTGYLTGGQNLTISGYGFDYGTIDAKIDGVTCKVTSKTKESFNC